MSRNCPGPAISADVLLETLWEESVTAFPVLVIISVGLSRVMVRSGPSSSGTLALFWAWVWIAGGKPSDDSRINT